MVETVTADASANVARPRDTAIGPESPIARQAFRLKLRYALFILGAIVLIVGSIAYWLSGGRHVETDDAYVEGNVLGVSTDVSGLVDQILVHEGEHVAKGQELFRLEPTRFQLAVDQAKANLGQTALQLRSLQADYATTLHQAAAQQAIVDADRVTFDRDAALVAHNAIARQQYDDAKYKLSADEAALAASMATAAAALARLGGKAGLLVEQMPAYRLAAAQLGQAERDLRHSVVRAAFDGVVTNVNKLQPGQFLAAGTMAFGLVDTVHMWIAAEPKETALTYVRPGEPATVTVDAYPGHVWHGEVQSVAPATDQQFSVLPAENSSGNWVKVLQRVPLRVAIEIGSDDPPLSAGMSTEISIDTHHRRTLGDLF
jgi:membrane fusion protein, multidrug efflux system